MGSIDIENKNKNKNKNKDRVDRGTVLFLVNWVKKERLQRKAAKRSFPPHIKRIVPSISPDLLILQLQYKEALVDRRL